MGKKIAVVGSSNTDMIIKVPWIPKPGETILGGVFTTAAGGKGANQAVGAARAGGDVSFIARVGQDMFGQQAVQGFIEDGIDVECVVRDPDAPSGVAQILVADDGENSIAVASGANGNLSPDDMRKAESKITSADILLMQLEIPIETVEAAADIAARNNIKIILNPAPAQQLSDELLSKVSILTPNQSEAELLTGVKVENEKDAARAAEILMAKGVDVVIVTLGSKGAYIVSSDMKELVEGYVVKAVDATAAGDVFNGALAVGLADGKTLSQAVSFANAAAALSVTKLGAQPSAPKYEDIIAMQNG